MTSRIIDGIFLGAAAPLANATGILLAVSNDVVLSEKERDLAKQAARKIRRITKVHQDWSGTIKTSRENCTLSTARAFHLLVVSLAGENRASRRVETVRAARLVLQLGERLHPMLPEVRKVILEKLKKIQAVETNSTESVTNDMRAAN